MKTNFVLLVALLGLIVTTLPAVAADSDIPRTADGKPDLSGNYNLASLTPMQRDEKYGENLYMTKEEAEEIWKTAANFRELTSRDSDPDRGAPPAGGDGSPGPAGDVGGYNFFWIDNGTDTFSLDGKFQTSIIYDPPNGGRGSSLWVSLFLAQSVCFWLRGRRRLTMSMRVRWREFELPNRVECDEETKSDNYGRFVIEPFERGFGHTVGNSLRRVLLSSIEGAATVLAKIDGVDHEFTSKKGVYEDITHVILNMKQIL